jgi:hypothetical protein
VQLFLREKLRSPDFLSSWRLSELPAAFFKESRTKLLLLGATRQEIRVA